MLYHCWYYSPPSLLHTAVDVSFIIVLLQELTEEGVPFLILFHHPDDKDTPAQFLEQVNLQLANDRGNNICWFIAIFILI